jgi:type I restriction enzyme S subunit
MNLQEIKKNQYPKSWKQYRLSKLLSKYKLGGNYKNSEDASSIPLIKMGNLGRGNINLKKVSKVVDGEIINDDDILKKGDLLFNTRNTLDLVGKVSVWREELDIAAYNSNLLRLNFSELIHSNYFMNYCLNSDSSIRKLKRIATGTTSVAAIYTKDLLKIKLIIPSLIEQQKIAQILAQWDEAIETTQNLIEKLKLRKKGLMQELLSGKKRLSGFSEEWKEIRLGAVTNRIIKKNTELNDNVITISAKRGFIRQEEYFKKRVASKTLSGYYLIKKGHFAYNKSYSNGYPMGAFKRLDTLDKAVVTTLYICFEAKDNVDSDFLLNYFEGGMITKNLTRIAQEGGRAHGLLNIGINDFFNLRLTVPSLNEQKEISKVLNIVDEELNSKLDYLENLKEQKKGLMQQLLTGQKRVKLD